MSRAARIHLFAAGYALAAMCLTLGLTWSLAAAAQDVALPPLDVPAAWSDHLTRAAFAVLVLTALVETCRWFVPGWERAPGVKLSPGRRRALLVIVLVGGQVLAAGGVTTTPWVEPLADACAGFVVSVGSVVFNELIWKRIARLMQDRLGVEPKRVRDARAEVPRE